jgi:hypothetical protein
MLLLISSSVALASTEDALVAQVSESMSSDASFSRFGVSLGMGALTATGNRGVVWNTLNPIYDLTLLYWLTPHVALDIEGFYARPSTNYWATDAGGAIDTGIKHIEFGTRLYGDLRSIAPRLGFISPFFTLGAGIYSKSDESWSDSTVSSTDNELGMSVGAGVRLQVIPKSIAFEFLGRWNSVNFRDNDSMAFFNSGIPDLSGQIFTWNGNLVVTF